MHLYGSLTSPFVRKLRILLSEKGLPYDFTVADAWGADSPIPALNPLGKVPAMVADDGEVYFDSAMIVEVIDAGEGPAMIPARGQARWDVLRWHALSQGILDAAVTRLLELRRPEPLRSLAVVERQEGKISAALAFAERGLATQPRSWLCGDSLSLADISLGVALGYIDFRYPHPWRDALPALAAWSVPILARPSFAATPPPPA
jgi:glutathione S-transferase